MHPATIRLVDKLEALRLVENRGGANRRSLALHLTVAENTHVGSLFTSQLEVLRNVIEPLLDEQMSALDDIAETLLDRLTTSKLEAGHICRLCD